MHLTAVKKKSQYGLRRKDQVKKAKEEQKGEKEKRENLFFALRQY